MSMTSTTYFGVYVDMIGLISDPMDDEYEQYCCGFKDEKFSMIYDAVCGKYCYFGITLASINEDSQYDECGTEIDIEDLPNMKYNVVDKLREMGFHVLPNPPKLIAFIDFR